MGSNPTRSTARAIVNQVGILAYGSLIADPGRELAEALAGRIQGVQTPFRVEFARKSTIRGGAPTLVPVETGGAEVAATVLVLRDDVSESAAADMLWRRETGRVGSGERYRRSATPSVDHVRIQRLANFHGIAVVTFAQLAPNLARPTARELAQLAITSAQGSHGESRRDGISYLLQVKEAGIVTPLMDEYETEILRQTGTRGLTEAWQRSRQSMP